MQRKTLAVPFIAKAHASAMKFYFIAVLLHSCEPLNAWFQAIRNLRSTHTVYLNGKHTSDQKENAIEAGVLKN